MRRLIRAAGAWNIRTAAVTILLGVTFGTLCGCQRPEISRRRHQPVPWSQDASARRALIELVTQAHFDPPGRPLRTPSGKSHPGGGTIPARLSAAVGSGDIVLEKVKLKDQGTVAQRFGVRVTLRAPNHSMSLLLAPEEILLGYQVGGSFRHGGRAYRLIELAGCSTGSGVYYRLVGILVSCPKGRSGDPPAFEGWLPLATFERSGVDEFQAESAELFVDTDGNLSVVGVLQWRHSTEGGDLVTAPWRCVWNASGLKLVRKTCSGCGRQGAADRAGVVGLLPTALMHGFQSLTPGAKSMEPWSLVDMPGVEIVAVGTWPDHENVMRFFDAEASFETATEELIREGPPLCAWLATR